MTAIDLGKQEGLGTDPKLIPQITLTGNLKVNATIFFIIEEPKETNLEFLQGTVGVLRI